MMPMLDREEVLLLDEILSQYLRQLLSEIAHADDRAFRDDLRDRCERTEALRGPRDPAFARDDPEVMQVVVVVAGPHGSVFTK